MSKDLTKAVVEQLESQHAIHGMWGRVFERWGGEDRLLDWADENPGKFLTLMTKMVPNMTPINSIQGDVNIVVNPALVPTDLDAQVIDGQGKVVELDG